MDLNLDNEQAVMDPNAEIQEVKEMPQLQQEGQGAANQLKALNAGFSGSPPNNAEISEDKMTEIKDLTQLAAESEEVAYMVNDDDL